MSAPRTVHVVTRDSEGGAPELVGVYASPNWARAAAETHAASIYVEGWEPSEGWELIEGQGAHVSRRTTDSGAWYDIDERPLGP